MFDSGMMQDKANLPCRADGGHSPPWYSNHAKAVGGSGKHQLADGPYLCLDTIGKLRRLRLPLPPGIHQISIGRVAAVGEGAAVRNKANWLEQAAGGRRQL